MALSNNSQSDRTIITIVGGKFTVRLEENDNNPNAETRILEKGPNAGKAVKELKYTNLSGFITGGEIHNGEYGDDLNLLMEDGDIKFKLCIPIESRYFSQVAKRIPNINTDEKIMFGMAIDKEKGKPFLYAKQDGPVKFAFTKDNPNGMPEPEKKTVKGKVQWDFTDQENFLYDLTVNWLEGLNSDNPPSDQLPEGDDSFDVDDLPL